MADKFPESLPGFQKMFPDDAACAKYLEAIRWRDGFKCPKCGATAEPFRFAARPHQLRCKGCKKDTSLIAGTVMERTHTPLSTWFLAAFLISALTPGMSAVQLQRQLGLTRYETAFQILHKLRAGMATTSGRIGLPYALLRQPGAPRSGHAIGELTARTSTHQRHALPAGPRLRLANPQTPA